MADKEHWSVDKRIPLAKGNPQTGQYKVFEFTMDYLYLYTPPKEGALGSLDFTGSLKTNYIYWYSGGYAALTIWIYLLDANGSVLERRILYDVNYRRERYKQKGSFKLSMDTPVQTEGISFSHLAPPWRSGNWGGGTG